MKKRIPMAVGAAALIGGWFWFAQQQPSETSQLRLYGNVDIRQVALAFDNAGRIQELMVEEGDRVARGQVLGTLDTRTLELQIAAQEASVEAQRQVVLRLTNGARPQEIAQAEAQLDAARAAQELSDHDLDRTEQLYASRTEAVSLSRLEQAQAQANEARARVAQAQAALELVRAGARAEEIAQAQAQLNGAEVQLELLRHQLSLAELSAPVDAVVRSRLRQPGDMVSASTPVFALAMTQPKWVRVYVGEPDLGQLTPGMSARVFSDSDPDPVTGQVGYISAVAEFTPNSVQTEELRSALVYEVHVILDDPDERLRLGQPVTVHLEMHLEGELDE